MVISASEWRSSDGIIVERGEGENLGAPLRHTPLYIEGDCNIEVWQLRLAAPRSLRRRYQRSAGQTLVKVGHSFMLVLDHIAVLQPFPSNMDCV